MVFFLFNFLLLTRCQCLSFSWASISFLIASTKFILSGWLVASLNVKVSFHSFLFDTKSLVKLGRLYGEDLPLSSCWRSLAAKLTVSLIMDLVADMATCVKRAMSPNTLGMKYPLFSLSLSLLCQLSPEIRRLTYYGIRREGCEGMSCSSSSYSLISVGFCTLLEWIIW